MAADSIDQAPVPIELTDTAIGLVWRAQFLLCDVDELVRDVVRLEGAVELLRPHVDDITDDDIAEAWHRDGGVQTLRTLLCQISAVIEHHTGVMPGDLRSLAETNNVADAWRFARGDGR